MNAKLMEEQDLSSSLVTGQSNEKNPSMFQICLVSFRDRGHLFCGNVDMSTFNEIRIFHHICIFHPPFDNWEHTYTTKRDELEGLSVVSKRWSMPKTYSP